MNDIHYSLKDLHTLLGMISELNMEDENNLVGIEELRELIELVGTVNRKYNYSGWAGMRGLNDGLRKYIDQRRFEENKLPTYLSWWIKRAVELELGIENPDES